MVFLLFYRRLESFDWNQKLTVTVATPEGDRSGSAITHVELKLLKPGSTSIGATSASYRSNGEAVVVPLPDGRVLFVLRYENASTPSQTTFLDTLLTEAERNALYHLPVFCRKLVASDGLSGTLPVSSLSRFVTFDDPTDPASVTLVDPDNLAATFGPGDVLKSVTIEITKEPVAYGEVEQVLPWLRDYVEKQFRLNGKKCVACPVASENISDMLAQVTPHSEDSAVNK